MPRTKQEAEFNTFVGGIVTDVSPLTFPNNASIDEDNFVLEKDGSRKRRLGMDLESGAVTIDTGIAYDEEKGLVSSSYKWENAGAVAGKVLLVVQMGVKIFFFDAAAKPISGGLIDTKTLSIPTSSLKEFSYAVVDGKLVVATGSADIAVFIYDPFNNTISKETKRLKIRDSFGVEDKIGGEDLLTGSGLSIRPGTFTNPHVYNLRNQTWGVPRAHREAANPPVEDPLDIWFREPEAGGKFPSNSDSTIYALFGRAESSVDPVSLRLVPKSIINNVAGSFRAPTGHFIIDMMDRGASRRQEIASMNSAYPQMGYNIGSLPTDRTPGGPSVVAEFAGRVWYGGFSGDVTGGDSQSPNLSSYISYSQIVQNTGDINKCYQEGDPTSDQFPDLLDTDGGFIKIDNAFNIHKIISMGDGILVLAENGVWRVSGGSDNGFTANSHIVSKITPRGTTSPNSIVLADNSVFYWGNDGIYRVGVNEFGDWTSSSVSQPINRYLSEISPEEKANASGLYDSYDNKVRWLYYPNDLSVDSAKELVFDLLLGAFYPSTIKSIAGGMPKPVMPVDIPQFSLANLNQDVVNGGILVEDSTVQVIYGKSIRSASTTREIAYVSATDVSGSIKFTFSLYSDPKFVDWKSVDSVGVDAPAYMITGYINNGDFQKQKQVPYIFFHLKRTEDGFEVIDSEIEPTNKSSCLVQAQWDWANSSASGRWGRQFQAYRLKRHKAVSDVGDPFDNGFLTVVSKNKLRGRGRVLSLFIQTEPGKDLDLLGWSLTLGSNSNV